MKKFYITAAIPYVNGAPHVGHALEFVQCDVIARYHRQIGNQTILLTGADENSLKNVQAAEKEGISTQDLCDRNSKRFQDLITTYHASFDVFQRSSLPNHFEGSQELWRRCEKNGDIYKKSYSGLYCVGCEQFYTKEELTPEGLCPEHLTKPQNVSEENYFFRLSKYQKQITDLIESDTIQIIPQTRKNEVLSFVKGGLQDFSISRSNERARNWGVPVPDDKTQKMYVWFDALNVYQTGIGFGSDEKKYNKIWPADAHVIGKGIIRFHAVYWPAILLSAGLKLPKSILVHGYITIEGQKMSKSLGNVIDPFELVKQYGADPVRYYLLREIPTTSDGDFSIRRFKEIYNADLANNLGNLLARVARLCEQSKLTFAPNAIPNEVKESSLRISVDEFIDKFEFHHALEVIWSSITELNIYIDKHEPWKLIKEGKTDEVKKVLTYLVEQIRDTGKLLAPFLPDTSDKIAEVFKGPAIVSQKPLFPRLT